MCAHFWSHKLHLVQNIGEDDAELLVIRFFGARHLDATRGANRRTDSASSPKISPHSSRGKRILRRNEKFSAGADGE
jgi:hypothetical protein